MADAIVKNYFPAKSGAAFSQYDPVKLTTEDTENEGKVVIKTAATTDICVGVALQDATASGQGVDVATIGDIVPMRCASGGVALGARVGLDGTDKTEIVALTFSSGGGTNRQIIGIALKAGAENEYIPVLLTLGGTVETA